MPHQTPAREYAAGMGQAVADRTINRKILREVDPYTKTVHLPRHDDTALDDQVAAWAKSNGFAYSGYTVLHGDQQDVEIELFVTGERQTEAWADVAYRVALGNSFLHPVEGIEHGGEALARAANERVREFDRMHHHLRQASLLMSGRHLQHGDENQPKRNMEVFTNCSTAAVDFLGFYLLLNGSGVGRAYDDNMMVVDLRNLPMTVCVCDQAHQDIQQGLFQALDLKGALHLYGHSQRRVEIFEVPDSREGWAKAIEKMEVMAFRCEREKVLLLDFSKVRPKGSPIGGMQNRPASGPGPLISAINNVARLREAGMEPWRSALYADHYLAECVLVGGARRAARMSTKTWRDKSVLEFIAVKRGGFLWSSNNSVTVDREFWDAVKKVDAMPTYLRPYSLSKLEQHAWAVFEAICTAAYHDQTGEPGLITVDRLTHSDEGTDVLMDGDFAESARYQLEPETLELTRELAKRWKGSCYKVITNPCVPGDTPILTRDGYVPIVETVGKEVEVWNGHEFSRVTPFSTGFNPTLRVELSNGVELRCTPAHKFVLAGERYHPEGERKQASELKVGDKLAKYTMPIVESGVSHGDAREAYSQGFYSGDGNTDMLYSWLYAPKFVCESRLIGRFGDVHDSVERKTWTHGIMRAKNWVPLDGDLSYCLNWLAGLLDSDGTVCTDKKGGQNLQVVSVDKDFLLQVRLMLTRLGVQATVGKGREECDSMMPDGRGGQESYHCQATWRLTICNFDAWRLVNELGLSLTRLSYTAKEPNRSAARFIRVVAIHEDVACETYCFTEPVNHTGTFNGIVTGQCGEIVLNMLGGYCVIADVVPFHAGPVMWRDIAGVPTPFKDLKVWDDDTEDAFRVATRALIRTNLMDSLYGKEVKRTNRIGVGMTGIHSYAFARFGYGWKDLVDEAKSKDFWLMLSRFKRAVKDEAFKYATELGVTVPHTDTTMKPAGTTSKLFGLEEGAHLPTMREFLRWVQFRNGDPLIDEYRAKGYPVRELRIYSGTTIVGFPTKPTICTLGMGDKLVTAAEATPEEQYEYLRLLEKYWITGVEEDGVTPLHESGNQVSYTLKYDPAVVSFEEFKRTLLEGQSTIRCCSVMPQSDTSAYEYLPEQPVSKLEYEAIADAIARAGQMKEDVDFAHVDCSSGSCPIDFNKEST